MRQFGSQSNAPIRAISLSRPIKRVNVAGKLLLTDAVDLV
jgi:hypothetical protein